MLAVLVISLLVQGRLRPFSEPIIDHMELISIGKVVLDQLYGLSSGCHHWTASMQPVLCLLSKFGTSCVPYISLSLVTRAVYVTGLRLVHWDCS